MAPKNEDTWFEDDELVREGGVFVARDGGHEVGCGDDRCAPDDYVEDPVNDDNVPGTVDDLPYTYGVEVPRAADETLESVLGTSAPRWGAGATGPAGSGDEQPLGQPEELELWGHQMALIEESESEERHYRGLADTDIRKVANASAENAEEALPDVPDGVSATGSATTE